MILKKTIFQISVITIILIVTNFNLAVAQFEIKDSSNFKLVYKSLSDSYVDRADHDFVGNYMVRQWIGPGITKFFKEPILQIIDLTDSAFYEYFPESKRINKTNRPTELGSYPNHVLSQKDSISDKGKYT